MKSLNRRLHEEVLEPMFPGEFTWKNASLLFKGEVASYIDAQVFLVDAFFLADKVGLFTGHYLMEGPNQKQKWGITEFGKPFNSYFGQTPQEAIVNAIIAIYGEK